MRIDSQNFQLNSLRCHFLINRFLLWYEPYYKQLFIKQTLESLLRTKWTRRGSDKDNDINKATQPTTEFSSLFCRFIFYVHRRQQFCVLWCWSDRQIQTVHGIHFDRYGNVIIFENEAFSSGRISKRKDIKPNPISIHYHILTFFYPGQTNGILISIGCFRLRFINSQKPLSHILHYVLTGVVKTPTHKSSNCKVVWFPSVCPFLTIRFLFRLISLSTEKKTNRSKSVEASKHTTI